MREVFNIINEIAATSSRTEKESILRNNKDNEQLKSLLKFVYNPFIVTGISKKKMGKNTIITDRLSNNFNTFEQVVEYLKKNNTGRDIDIARVHSFVYSHSQDLADFYKQVFTKDLTIGITADTINKVFGNFIPTFDVMLAKKYEDHKSKIKGNFVVTEKLDGNRIVVIKDNGVVKSFTRQGKQYEGLEEIESDIKNLPLDNIVFDGELIADCKGSTHEVYTETTSKARSKGSNKTGLIFHIFDMLPLDEFQNGISKQNCVERKSMLSKVFADNSLPHCKEVKPLYIGSDLSYIKDFMAYANSQGWEGLMVNLDKPYVCKRSDSILKVKVMSTCDVRVIDFEEGTGKYVGKLGALVVDYKGFRVGVGSGFTDFDREYIWNHKDEYLNMIIELQYFEESKNQDGGLSLRFPVFKKLRTDKSEESYN